jgi:uncharacterized protein (DUF697 family)
MTTCKEEALRWVHRYAIGGGAFAAIPLPVTSTGLATIEMHMWGFIGSIYGDPMGAVATVAAGGSLSIMGQGLKWVAMQAALLVPVLGIVVRIVIAAATIETIGHAIIAHYERKYPDKVFTQKPA